MAATRDQQRSSAERTALRKRIRHFYRHFNREDWAQCYELIDPKLRNEDKVDGERYKTSLGVFYHHYGPVNPKHVDVSLYLDAKGNKHDDPPFAYVYIFWKDKRYQFHVFRERWVKQEGDWYTRVVGLVTHAENEESGVK